MLKKLRENKKNKQVLNKLSVREQRIKGIRSQSNEED